MADRVQAAPQEEVVAQQLVHAHVLVQGQHHSQRCCAQQRQEGPGHSEWQQDYDHLACKNPAEAVITLPIVPSLWTQYACLPGAETSCLNGEITN